MLVFMFNYVTEIVGTDVAQFSIRVLKVTTSSRVVRLVGMNMDNGNKVVLLETNYVHSFHP